MVKEREGKTRGNDNLVRPGKWQLTCITYKPVGEPKPLEAVKGVLVKNEREQRSVERYLKELYEFPSKKDYQAFVKGFIVRNGGGKGLRR